MRAIELLYIEQQFNLIEALARFVLLIQIVILFYFTRTALESLNASNEHDYE